MASTKTNESVSKDKRENSNSSKPSGKVRKVSDVRKHEANKKPRVAKPIKETDKSIDKTAKHNTDKPKKNTAYKVQTTPKLVLKCSKVTKKINNGLRLLKECSFSAYKGEAVAILAPSHNSKSTFAKIICGLVPPSSGEVTIRGNKAGRKTNQYVSYQPEIPFVKNESTISDLMNMYSRFFSDFDFRYSFRLLKQFKISPKTKFNHLSGTAIQIVETVLVASRRTSLYVFDDPLVHTDPKYRSELIDIIGNCKKFGAVVILSQVVDDIDKIANKVIMLKRGEVYIALNSDEYKGKNRLSALYKEVFKHNA